MERRLWKLWLEYEKSLLSTFLRLGGGEFIIWREMLVKEKDKIFTSEKVSDSNFSDDKKRTKFFEVGVQYLFNLWLYFFTILLVRVFLGIF